MNLCTRSFVKIIKNGGGRLFHGVYDTIKNLYTSGYKIFVASNGRREYIEAILETAGIINFFSEPFIYLNKNITDKTAIISYYLKNIPKKTRLIMIGDRYTDRIAASDNAIPFIGCSFGHAGVKEISGSKWIAEKFTDIPALIRKIEKQNKFEK